MTNLCSKDNTQSGRCIVSISKNSALNKNGHDNQYSINECIGNID
jgi:hypothetical protein